MILVLDFDIGHGLCTSLIHRAWIGRISFGLCISLNVRGDLHSCIPLGLNTMASWHQIWVAHIICTRHIAQPTSVIDLLCRSCVLIIAKLASTNERQHHLLLYKIKHVISTYDIKHHPRPRRMRCGVCASRGQNRRAITEKSCTHQ